MEKIVVNHWTELPIHGIRFNKFVDKHAAFQYAEKEFAEWGYNYVYFDTSTNICLITQEKFNNITNS